MIKDALTKSTVILGLGNEKDTVWASGAVIHNGIDNSEGTVAILCSGHQVNSAIQKLGNISRIGVYHMMKSSKELQVIANRPFVAPYYGKYLPGDDPLTAKIMI
jgi:hypothetical protein